MGGEAEGTMGGEADEWARDPKQQQGMLQAPHVQSMHWRGSHGTVSTACACTQP